MPSVSPTARPFIEQFLPENPQASTGFSIPLHRGQRTPLARPTRAAYIQPVMNPIVKFLVEVGPLAAFFIAYSTWGGGDKANLIGATAVFMVAITASLIVSVWLERRVPLMPLVSAAVVMVFGGLTLALDSEIFIKMKPTIINALFAAGLFVGLAMRRAFLKHLFGAVMHLDEEGWRKLSWRWGFFFIAVAILNEIVWRSFSTDTWVNFKVFGILPLTLVFALSQTPLIQRHTLSEDSTGKDAKSKS